MTDAIRNATVQVSIKQGPEFQQNLKGMGDSIDSLVAKGRVLEKTFQGVFDTASKMTEALRASKMSNGSIPMPGQSPIAGGGPLNYQGFANGSTNTTGALYGQTSGAAEVQRQASTYVESAKQVTESIAKQKQGHAEASKAAVDHSAAELKVIHAKIDALGKLASAEKHATDAAKARSSLPKSISMASADELHAMRDAGKISTETVQQVLFDRADRTHAKMERLERGGPKKESNPKEIAEGLKIAHKGAEKLGEAMFAASALGETSMGRVVERLLQMKAVMGSLGAIDLAKGLNQAGVFSGLAGRIPGSHLAGRLFKHGAGGVVMGAEGLAGLLGLGGSGAAGAGVVGAAGSVLGAGAAAIGGTALAGYASYDFAHQAHKYGFGGGADAKSYTWRVGEAQSNAIAEAMRYSPLSYGTTARLANFSTMGGLGLVGKGFFGDMAALAQSKDRLEKSHKFGKEFDALRPGIEAHRDQVMTEQSAYYGEFNQQIGFQRRMAGLNAPQEYGAYNETGYEASQRGVRNRMAELNAEKGIAEAALAASKQGFKSAGEDVEKVNSGRIGKGAEGMAEHSKEVTEAQVKQAAAAEQVLKAQKEVNSLKSNELALQKQAVALEKEHHAAEKERTTANFNSLQGKLEGIHGKQEDFNAKVAGDPYARARLARWKQNGGKGWSAQELQNLDADFGHAMPEIRAARRKKDAEEARRHGFETPLQKEEGETEGRLFDESQRGIEADKNARAAHDRANDLDQRGRQEQGQQATEEEQLRKQSIEAIGLLVGTLKNVDKTIQEVLGAVGRTSSQPNAPVATSHEIAMAAKRRVAVGGRV